MIQRSPRTCLAGFMLIATLSGCGGGGSSTPTGQPRADSDSRTAADAYPSSRSAGCAPSWSGLVVSPQASVHRVSAWRIRDVGQDPATGHWIVYKGDFVVFDSDQFNAAGDKCKWVNNPQWFIDGIDIPEQTLHPNGIVFRKGSSNPFLLRVDMADDGEFRLTGRVDGVDSDTMIIESRRK